MVPSARVASLGYHDITDDGIVSGFQSRAAAAYRHSGAVFARHLEAIASSSAEPSLITEVNLARPGRHVTLSFDDGGRGALEAAQALQARGWRGHFFIVTSLLGATGFLNAAGVRYLRECGHLVGSHSHTHPHILRDQRAEELVDEWRVSRDRLEQMLGERCSVASVPGGDISRAVLESAAAVGLTHLFTSEPWLTPRRVDGCWVLGRAIVKATTSVARVGELASHRGWSRELATRRLKGAIRTLMPAPYRLYVDLTTRDDLASAATPQGA